MGLLPHISHTFDIVFFLYINAYLQIRKKSFTSDFGHFWNKIQEMLSEAFHESQNGRHERVK
jgi:hypothetical protein